MPATFSRIREKQTQPKYDLFDSGGNNPPGLLLNDFIGLGGLIGNGEAQAVLSPSACRARARECRAIARAMGDEHRRYLLKMARIWEGLARDRERLRNRRIARMLKATFGKIAQEPVPEAFHRLLGRLESAQSYKDSRH